MQTTPRYSLSALVLSMFRLGTIGFRGPVALVGYMQRDLVEARGWISKVDYKLGLASGLAIVPFHYGGVVKEHAWLDEGQVVDAVAVAMITPGPAVITVVVLARRSIVDGPTLTIAPLTAGMLWKFKNLKEPVVIAAAALVGLLTHPLVAGI